MYTCESPVDQRQQFLHKEFFHKVFNDAFICVCIRIKVNDQIVEVDGTSLVGVTQSFAASVLRNTSGVVR